MNDRQRAVYELLRTLHPNSQIISETLAVSVERRIADLMRGYETAHAYDAQGEPFLPWLQAVGRQVVVYRWGNPVMAGVIAHLRQDRDGDTWAVFTDGRQIRLQEGMRWEVVRQEGAQA